jgi:two-component system response regulator HydG
MERYHVHSLLCAPLAVAGTNEGAICLDAVDHKSRFNKDDLSLLTLIANELSLAIENARMFDRICKERDSLGLQNIRLQEQTQRYDFSAIVGSSRAVTELIEAATRAAAVDSTVLITGSSGTGKELVARAIHSNGPRRDKPFFSLNCAAIAKDLVESELFGHEKGAFTGATAMKPGLFEMANQGSVLLDEIGDMPLDLQAKLLKVLEDREVRRIGGREMIPIDVRVIAATNKDLAQEITHKRFRDDLFYRLNVVRIDIPPLRKRKEDILPLANHFLNIFAVQMHKTITGFTPDAVHALQQYHWPGNVRELRNVVERAVLEVGSRTVIDKIDLPANVQDTEIRMPKLKPSGKLSEMVEQLEHEIISAVLKETGGNRSEAARTLGVSRQGLLKKINRYGIEA